MHVIINEMIITRFAECFLNMLNQYFSLYTPEMQELRIKAKPGLLPPFYYERKTPETLDEVQESERRYMEAYLKAPFATDWKYFWGIIGNIVFHRKHSS